VRLLRYESRRVPASQPQEWTIETVLRWATDDFRVRGIDSPRLDAELLLGRAISCTRIQLIADAKRALDSGELARFKDLVKRRRAREPTAYILGEREFYGRMFRVDRRVLIPRPDTETLVEVALERTRARSMSMRALDLCTGSGCVAITLARERRTSLFVAADVSGDALAVARENARRLGAYNVAFRQGDLFAAVDASFRFDLVTANPPYIADADMSGLQPEVRDYEPRVALSGGADGLEIVRLIVAGARPHLAGAGRLVLEVGFGEAAAAAAILASAGFEQIEIRRDYARVERVVSGVLERP
jgi:release factor glutamine methyltransferase